VLIKVKYKKIGVFGLVIKFLILYYTIILIKELWITLICAKQGSKETYKMGSLSVFKQRITVCLFAFLICVFCGTSMAHAECTGATYYDSDIQDCVSCPTGYDYNKDSGKTDVSQCQIQCQAGTYIDKAKVAGYTPLEYLQGDGTAYIKTSFTHSSTNIRGEMRIGTKNKITTNVNIIGNQTSNSGYSVGWADNAFKVWVVSSYSRLNGPTQALTAGLVQDLVYEFTSDERKITYNDKTMKKDHAGGIVSSNTIHIFENGTHETGQNFSGRIYYIRLYEDDVLVHNFIPVKNASGVPGLLDTVTNKFFTDASGTSGFEYAEEGDTVNCVNVGAGYYSETSVVNFGSVGTKIACPKGTYSDIDNAGSLLQCKQCLGATYNDILGATGCSACPTEYNYNITAGKTDIAQCQLRCLAGTYLPPMTADYSELEYIEITGTQYINTNLKLSTLINPIMSVTLQYTQVQNGKQTGAVKSGVNFKVGISNTGKFLCQAAGSGSETTFGSADTDKHTFVLNSHEATCTFDDTVHSLSVGDLSSMNVPLFVGSLSASDTNRIGKVKIYNFSVISDNQVVLHLIPARRNSDSAIGMLDTVHNEFYENRGTDVFVPGSTTIGCIDVGDGYYIAENIVNYGSNGEQPHACPNGALTHMTNASDISACDTHIDISLTWQDIDGTVIEQNTCTYGENIVLPDNVPNRVGYDFVGWRVVRH
jgi:hypothetical protein